MLLRLPGLFGAVAIMAARRRSGIEEVLAAGGGGSDGGGRNSTGGERRRGCGTWLAGWARCVAAWGVVLRGVPAY